MLPWNTRKRAPLSILYFLLSLLYSLFCRLEITSAISSMLYFGYMATASWGFFLLTGSIGFVSTLFFVRRIFGAIKVD